MSFQESDAIYGLLKLGSPSDTTLQLPAIRPQHRTNVSLPNLSSLLSDSDTMMMMCPTQHPHLMQHPQNYHYHIPQQEHIRMYDSQDLNAKQHLLRTLSRAASFTVQRTAGRSKKKALVKKQQQQQQQQQQQSQPQLSRSSSVASDLSSSKPRWQEAERLELLEAIVKEKNLDDMKTIRWDRIAMAVGRAKKACKDQWRREVLPSLLKNLKPSK